MSLIVKKNLTRKIKILIKRNNEESSPVTHNRLRKADSFVRTVWIRMVSESGLHCRTIENHFRNSQISGMLMPIIVLMYSHLDDLATLLQEDSENESFEWKSLEEINHEHRCSSIAFAPETSLAVIPKVVKLATAGSDYKLRIFHTNLDSKPTVQTLPGKCFLIEWMKHVMFLQ